MPAPLDPSTDIKSTNKAAALLELAFSLQASEAAVPEETRPNNITISIDAETGAAAVTATLPVTFTVDNTGKVVVTGVDYIP